jgi:hypothetical protein
MSYKSPTLRELTAFAEELRKSYTDSNPKRHSFIALYDQLVAQTTHSTDLPQNIMNVLIGALVFEMSDIKFGEYGGKSPKYQVGWVYSSGSKLYTTIKAKLNISPSNKFGYDERLFYLHEFAKYVDKVYPDEGIQELKSRMKSMTPTWRNKKELKDNIRKALVPVLKENDERLYSLVHGVPVLNALLKNLQKLEDEYNKDSRNATNPKRLATIHFIKFVIQTYQGMNPNQISWHACVGAVIFALIQVEHEYKVLSPTRSALFRAALKAINAESLDKIAIDDKIKCLRALSAHVTTVRDNPVYFKDSVNSVVNNDTKQKLEFAAVDKEINFIQTKIEQYLIQLDEIKKAPSNTQYAVSTGVSYSIQYALGPVALQVAKNAVIGGLGIGGFFAAGPVGSALFSAAGALVFSGVGRLVTTGILNALTANIFVWLLEKMGDSIGNATATVVTYPFAATPKGFEEMRAKLKPEDDIAFVNMVNTLLELESVSASDKEHIRNVLGIDKDAKLKPLKTSIPQSQAEIDRQNALLVDGYVARTYAK